MNVNEKGVKGLVKTLDDLGDKGYYCFTAFDDHSPVDLIAMNKAGKTFRLQVKYRNVNPKGLTEKYTLQAFSVVNGRKVPVDRSLIDGWAVYLAGQGKMLYVPVEQVHGGTMTLYPDSQFNWELNNKISVPF